jgi:hypothetical protein
MESNSTRPPTEGPSQLYCRSHVQILVIDFTQVLLFHAAYELPMGRVYLLSMRDHFGIQSGPGRVDSASLPFRELLMASKSQCSMPPTGAVI